MKETNHKLSEKIVGATSSRPHFEEKAKGKNGITLISLIITIIVMLILVGVSVTVAINGGLFNKTKEAANRMEDEMDKELALLDGPIEVDGKKYDSYEDYLNNKEIIELPTGWTISEAKPEGWSKNVTAITDGTNTIPLPTGFQLSTKETEDSIEEGLVLKDGKNEFVWVPVEESSAYVETNFGPTSSYTGNSQEELDYWYGNNYYSMDDFNYEEDQTNIEQSIQTYGGFFVGRYETTINGDTIGVQQGKTVLTATTLLKEGTNTTSNQPYYYRWWGLYKAQKDMYAKNEAVGSYMISSKQWDAIRNYTNYSKVKRRELDTYTTTPDLSGSAYLTDSTQYDIIKNIYDLAGNTIEWTSTSVSGDNMRADGWTFFDPLLHPIDNFFTNTHAGGSGYGSRVALYIRSDESEIPEVEVPDVSNEEFEAEEVADATIDIIVDEKSTINGEMYSSTNPIIPTGFMAINTETAKWDATAGPEADKGLVISDGNSEFVWIPVSNINEMVMCQKCGSEGVLGKVSLKCPTCGTDTKIAGKLYNFNNLTYYDYLTSSYYEPTSSYEANFREMALSVSKYKGFYIGRYETSVDSEGKAQSRKSTSDNVLVSANASTNGSWIGLYNLQRTYVTDSVKGELIWGSQYDAMVRWLETTAIGSVYNTTRNPGAEPNDMIKNIYDIYGNSYEWTQESYGTSTKPTRGGCYNKSTGTIAYRCVAGSTYSGTTATFDKNGSRMTLCITE